MGDGDMTQSTGNLFQLGLLEDGRSQIMRSLRALNELGEPIEIIDAEG
jgi:Polypeptide deformylase